MFSRNESFKDFVKLYPVVFSIVVTQVILFTLVFFDTKIGYTILQYGVGINALINNGDYYRLITPIFLHDWNDFTHVLFNSFALYLFGSPLEYMIGKFKFISLYLGAGIFANVFSYLLDKTSVTITVGASGAIYGLLGFIIYVIFFKKHIIDKESAKMTLTYAIAGIVLTFIQPNVSIPGHVFGLLGGFFFGPILSGSIRRFYLPSTRFYEEQK